MSVCFDHTWANYQELIGNNDLNPSYFDTVSHIIQQCVVDGLSNVAHRPLHVARGDDLVGARGVLVCGQDANLSTGHLLLMNIHCLRGEKWKGTWVKGYNRLFSSRAV